MTLQLTNHQPEALFSSAGHTERRFPCPTAIKRLSDLGIDLASADMQTTRPDSPVVSRLMFVHFLFEFYSKSDICIIVLVLFLATSFRNQSSMCMNVKQNIYFILEMSQFRHPKRRPHPPRPPPPTHTHRVIHEKRIKIKRLAYKIVFKTSIQSGHHKSLTIIK